MLARVRDLAAHAVMSLAVFGPVVVLGAEAAILLRIPTGLGVAYAVGMFFLWIGARFGDRQVWLDEPAARR